MYMWPKYLVNHDKLSFSDAQNALISNNTMLKMPQNDILGLTQVLDYHTTS